MPLYECVVIARQDISAQQAEAQGDELAKTLEEGGGSVKTREYWGLKTLTYRIRKNRKGHYTLFNIEAPAAAMTEAERLMRINEDVLRYLTIRVDEHAEGPSAMMRSRGGRDDRRGGRGGPRDRDRGPRDRDDRPRDRAPRPPREDAEQPAADAS